MANCMTPSPTVIDCNNLCNLCNFMKRVLPTSIDDELSELELFNKMVKWAKVAIQFDEQICAEWDSFQTKFDANIEDTVRDILNQWVLDGTLSDIINEEIFGELNNKITEIQSQITNILGHMADYVIVTQHDIANDGSDVATALQNLIDANPNKAIYFPDGTYGLTKPITTSCQLGYMTPLILSSQATIKALVGFDGEYVIELGGKGTYQDRMNHGIYIGGGIVDGGNLVGGIRTGSCQSPTVENLLIQDYVNYGLYVGDGSNASSSDGVFTNLSLQSARETADMRKSTGIYVKGLDNMFSNIWIMHSMRGMEFDSGGNLMTNVHAVGSNYDYFGDNYTDTCGFYIIDGNDNFFQNVYPDNFATGFHLPENKFNRFENIKCSWWDTSEKQHRCIEVEGQYMALKVDGMKVEFPATGLNQILVPTGNFYSGIFYPQFQSRCVIRDLLIHSTHILRMSYPLTDIGLSSFVNQINTNVLNNGGTIPANNWIPIAILSTANFGNTYLSVDCAAIGFDISLWLTDENTYGIGYTQIKHGSGATFQIAICNLPSQYGTTAETSRYRMIFMRRTDDTWSDIVNVTITEPFTRTMTLCDKNLFDNNLTQYYNKATLPLTQIGSTWTIADRVGE